MKLEERRQGVTYIRGSTVLFLSLRMLFNQVFEAIVILVMPMIFSIEVINPHKQNSLISVSAV